jgi:hypothetical protein
LSDSLPIASADGNPDFLFQEAQRFSKGWIIAPPLVKEAAAGNELAVDETVAAEDELIDETVTFEDELIDETVAVEDELVDETVTAEEELADVENR